MKLRPLAGLAATAFLLMIATGCSGSAAEPTPEAPLAGDPEGEFGDEVRLKTDAAIHEEIRAAAAGTIYVSEADYEFSLVKASLPADTRSITQEIVREKLAWYVDHDENADKPLATLFASNSDWAEWKHGYDPSECGGEGEYPGPEECGKIRNMISVLERNLRGIKVMYFGANGSRGRVDGVGVSLIIVGRTPKNNLAGVRVVAIWT
jgi:hypothetical protein